jgi:O-antigen/teichoic acid export membrane protein
VSLLDVANIPTEPAAPAASLRSRFQTGVTFNLIGAILNQGSTFAFNIIAANLLGRQVFGEYAMVQSTVVAFASIAQFAVPYTTTKYVAEFRASDPERAGRILGMMAVLSFLIAGIVSVAFLAASPWIAGSVLRTPSLALALAIASALVLITSLNGFLMGALAGLESYPRLAGALTWSGICYLVICSALAWIGGLNGAIIGLALSGLVQCVLLAFAVRKESALLGINLRFDGLGRERQAILKFNLPAGLSGLTSGGALWLPSAFLIRQVQGYSQMAVYSAAFSLTAVVLFLPNIANNVGTSIINQQKGTGNGPEYRLTFWINLAITAAVIVCAAGMFALLGQEFLRFFGKSFKEGYSVLLILLLSTVPQGLALAVSQIVQTQGKLWLFFLAVAIPRDTMIVLLAYLLIPQYGARGLAIAYVTGWTLAALATVVIVIRIGIDLVPRREQLAGGASY